MTSSTTLQNHGGTSALEAVDDDSDNLFEGALNDKSSEQSAR